MPNRYLDERYVERIDRLAVGVEPVDAGDLDRVPHVVYVQVEDVPQPVVAPESSPTRCVYDFGLPIVDRHGSSRWALLYTPATADTLTIRVFDCLRWYVPRRFALPVIPLARVLIAEAAAESPLAPAVFLPPQPPIAARTRRPFLYPGAAYPTDALVTGLRGRVFRDGQPMRWARIEARDPTSDALLGRAHGDDRGEFFLLVGSVSTPTSVAQLTDPVPARVSVFGPAVAPIPASTDPARLDPLWDLPVEVVPEPGDPDPVSSGELLPVGYEPTPSSTHVVSLPVGRVTSALRPFVFA
jgi:hypothetical protein